MKTLKTFTHWTGENAKLIEVPNRDVFFIVPETFPIEAVYKDCPMSMIVTNKARTYGWNNATVLAGELRKFANA